MAAFGPVLFSVFLLLLIITNCMFVKIFENIFQARSNVFTKFFSKEDFIKSSKVEFKMPLVLYFSCVLIVLHVFDIIPSNAIL